MKRFSVALAGLLISAGALSQDAGFYAGAGYGQSEGGDEGHFDIGGGGRRIDAKDTAWTGFAGYRFTRHLELEAGYWDLGATHYPGSVSCVYASDLEVTQLYVRANARLPLFAGVSLTGHAGGARSNFALGFSPSSNVTGMTCLLGPRTYPAPEDETGVVWGLGLDWDLSRRLGLRAAWGNHDTDVQDLTTLSLSLRLTF
jgi:hypothetical protein